MTPRVVRIAMTYQALRWWLKLPDDVRIVRVDDGGASGQDGVFVQIECARLPEAWEQKGNSAWAHVTHQMDLDTVQRLLAPPEEPAPAA